MIYSPMSGVGGIVYDKDAVYIELGHGAEAQRAKKVCLVPAFLLNNSLFNHRTGPNPILPYIIAKPHTALPLPT